MSWLAVAKKEYVENVRNAWVITVTVAFLLLTLLASNFARLGESFQAPGDGQTFANIVPTIYAMQNFSGFLLPILALVLGFATIAGERESGSLGLLTAQPLTRSEIVMGKWLGLAGVLSTAVALGFGIAGLIIVSSVNAGPAGYRALGIFLVETLAWGLAWISVTLFVSAFFDRRGTAIAGSVGIWIIFGTFVWNMLSFLLFILVSNPQKLVDPVAGDVPAWLILTQLLNPTAAYHGLLAMTLENYPAFISSFAQQLLPNLYTPLTLGLALAAWIVVPYVGALMLFQRKDV